MAKRRVKDAVELFAEITDEESIGGADAAGPSKMREANGSNSIRFGMIEQIGLQIDLQTSAAYQGSSITWNVFPRRSVSSTMAYGFQLARRHTSTNFHIYA